MKTKLKLTTILLILGLTNSFAQYGGGYGGGGYGGGGYGGRGYGSGIPRQDYGTNTPPKPETVDQEAANESKWLKKRLKLTEEQFLKVDDLALEFAVKRSNIRDLAIKLAGNEKIRQQIIKQFREDIIALQNEKEGLYKKIFTPEQNEIFEAKKKALPYYLDPTEPKPAAVKSDSTSQN